MPRVTNVLKFSDENYPRAKARGFTTLAYTGKSLKN